MKLLLESKAVILSALLMLLVVVVGGTTLADASSSRSRAIDADGVIVLAYFVADSSTSVAVITRNGVQTTSRVQVSREELTNLIWNFHQQIGQQPSAGKELVHYFATLGQANKLYNLLVAPIENAIKGAKHLVIVPSGPLSYLPFSALYVCPGCKGRDLLGGQFLIERYSVSYMPNLYSLRSGLQASSGGEYRSILAVGNPMGCLTSCREEAESIATLFPDKTVLIGSHASEKAVKDLLNEPGYDVVHFAGGVFVLDRQAPLLSGIRLLSGDNEDGIFRVDELLGLDVSIDLMTFSTGLNIESLMQSTAGGNGPVSSTGEAFCSVMDAILASGVASVIIPLGHVNSISTKYLMEVMYQQLRQGATKAEALRAAQLALLRDPNYRYPYYWAQFALYGNWRSMGSAIKPPDTGKLDYALYQKLQEWRTSSHAPGQTPPVISVVVTLVHPVTQKDLEALRALSDKIEIQGTFGSFVQLRLPLTLLDAVCKLPEVRSVTTPAETISN